MVGDGYTMGVTAKITEYMLRASERWFRVDHPILSKWWSQPRSKDFRLSQGLQVSVKTEAAVLKSVPECRDELAAKDSAEHFDRKKERIGWLDPTRAIGRKSTGRHHAMHMWVKVEFLTPGVQHAEKANFCVLHSWSQKLDLHPHVHCEFLTPGVQHAEKANFCAKMLGITGNFEQCFCTGSEQEIVDDLLILKSQWG